MGQCQNTSFLLKLDLEFQARQLLLEQVPLKKIARSFFAFGNIFVFDHDEEELVEEVEPLQISEAYVEVGTLLFEVIVEVFDAENQIFRQSLLQSHQLDLLLNVFVHVFGRNLPEVPDVLNDSLRKELHVVHCGELLLLQLQSDSEFLQVDVLERIAKANKYHQLTESLIGEALVYDQVHEKLDFVTGVEFIE